MTEPRPQHDHDATGPYQAPVPPSERFAPGALLAGRYRIVAALGKGGMGEVYRADDLTLGQAVALKFLPPHLATDHDRLARFRKEVAAARGVSHPSVCRVYDIAETDGQPFLTMEYIDGEDLASLLRRIGRLPEDKATAVARELCQALAAVHEQGLLHRDLKPQNVMLDGRGRVRLTDFGLAAAAADLSASEARSGTPLYQAPEQLAGRKLTTRSDLFALGLVLYELFTGRRPFPGDRRDTPPSKPSTHVTGLCPAVERVVLRCLELDPANRPHSASEVLGALPGGDPLAAAVAAGETPSPQMVADAGEAGRISPRLGLVLLGALAGGLLLLAWLNGRVGLLGRLTVTQPPAEMARRARQLLADFGYPGPPADAAGYFLMDVPYLIRVAQSDPSPDRWRRLADGRPAAVYFFYRQSPEPMAATSVSGEVPLIGRADPPPTRPGMATVLLDASGRLLELSVVPRNDDTRPRPGGSCDWGQVFRAAGLEFDPRTVIPDGDWVPPCAFDERVTVPGQLPDRPDVPTHVEAAAYGGRPVWFRLTVDGWVTGGGSNPPIGFVISLVLAPLVVLLAVRNIRAGRADWHGASCLTLFVLGTALLAWLIGGHHAPAVLGELEQAAAVVARYGLQAALLGLYYLALEPFVRRRWPWGQTAWNRLLAGRFRSPLVGRDVLAGLVFGVSLALLLPAASLGVEALGLPPPLPTPAGPPTPHGPLPPLTFALLAPAAGVNTAVTTFMTAFLLSLLFRRPWVYWPVFVVLWASGPLLAETQATAGTLVVTIAGGMIYFALIATFIYRFGWLGNLVAASCLIWMAGTPLTTDTSAWYFGWGLAGAAVVLALGVYGFVTAVGGQRVFREGFFGDE